MARINETRMYLGMGLVHINVDLMQVFVMISNVGVMINAHVNAKNWLTKVDVMMDSIGIPVYVNVKVINHVMLENI